MLDIGFLELLIIVALGLLVLGPDKLPGAMRTVMVWWKRLKSSVDSAKKQVEEELNYTEMQRQLESYKENIKKIGDEIGSIDDIDDFNKRQGKQHAASRSKNPSAIAKKPVGVKARRTTGKVEKRKKRPLPTKSPGGSAAPPGKNNKQY